MQKLLAKWVPRMLSSMQKQQRVEQSRECLELLRQDKKNFFRRYVTMDETWIHHYTPESKRQSAEWTQTGESRPKRQKSQPSAGKVMASVFWDIQGILFIDYLEKGHNINSEYYIPLLQRLKHEIALKRPHMQRKSPLFHQDNAPCHKSHATMEKKPSWAFSYFPTPHIPQTWPPVSTGFFPI